MNAWGQAVNSSLTDLFSLRKLFFFPHDENYISNLKLSHMLYCALRNCGYILIGLQCYHSMCHYAIISVIIGAS